MIIIMLRAHTDFVFGSKKSWWEVFVKIIKGVLIPNFSSLIDHWGMGKLLQFFSCRSSALCFGSRWPQQGWSQGWDRQQLGHLQCRAWYRRYRSWLTACRGKRRTCAARIQGPSCIYVPASSSAPLWSSSWSAGQGDLARWIASQ